jgi:aspartyl protease family protein
MLVLALSFAGAARANLGSVMDTFVPVEVKATRSSPSDRPVRSIDAVHKVERDADGLFYVHARVNGKPVRFLVDTGASVVVLTEADARAVGALVRDEAFAHKVDTVGGKTPMAWTTITSIELAGHDVRGLRAAVVKEGLGVSLLGQNMLAELHSVTMTVDGLSIR